METYVVFRGNKRVTLREDNLTTEKVARIFQLRSHSLYLTDDSNVAIFPRDDGYFSAAELLERGHYEVHGDSVEEPGPACIEQPVRFSFHRPSAAAGSPATARASATSRAVVAKSFQRNIFIAEVMDGKLETSKVMTVRFSEFEASVEGILSKVSDVFGEEETVILTDGQGKKILDSEGTRGSAFWKQCARKVFAVREEDFLQLQGSKKRRRSQQEVTGLDDVFERVEEVVLAAQGLKDVSATMKELIDLADSRCRKVTLTEAQAATMRDTFACVICKNLVDDPMMSSCCSSIVGCKICIEEWLKTSDSCPKCRASGFGVNTQRLFGLCEALAVLGSVLTEEE